MLNIPLMPKQTRDLFSKFLASPIVNNVFYQFEKLTKYKQLRSDGTKVLVANELSAENLTALFNNTILALHVPNYYSIQLTKKIVECINSENLQNWQVHTVNQIYKESDVFVLGTPFNLAMNNQSMWNRYFQTTDVVMNFLQNILSSQDNPIEQIMADFKLNTQNGIKIRQIDGINMNPGLLRVMYANKSNNTVYQPLNCHVDCMPILKKNHGQYSVNLYFKTPPCGGELYIWNTRFNNFFECLKHWYFFSNFFLKPSYLDHELQLAIQNLLPEPTKIIVNDGDLVLLNTARPHAVGNFIGDTRVSYQAFLNYEKSKPIELWA